MKSDSGKPALFREERKVNNEEKQHSFPGTFSVHPLSFKLFKCSFLETDRIPSEGEGRTGEGGKEMEEEKV